MRNRRGITLIELLLTLGLTVLVLVAAGRAFITGLNFSAQLSAGRAAISERVTFEENLTTLLRRAYLSSDTTSSNTFFIAGDTTQTASSTGLQQGQNNSPSGSGTDSLTFSIVGRRLPGSLLTSQDDFETNNRQLGTYGGVTEVSLQTTPLGDGGAGKQGLFVREQTPSDGDPTQGGYESLYNETVSQIKFEFFDGTQWITDWDTRSQTAKRLPPTIRVTYRFTGDDDDHIFLIQVPGSDVTPDNPLTVGS